MTKGAEEAIKNALLVGDFAAAVECCLRTGNMADALVLASCAGGDVWTRTQERYFQTEAPHKRFLGFMGAIVANELEDLVANSDTANWKETLAIASTYGQSGEFPALSVALGERLEAAGDSRSASLCYMCSISLDRTVKFWQSQLEAANKKKGSTDLLAIHEFVVKVSVFLKAMDPSTVLSSEIASVFAEYSALLAEQGLLITAANYSKGDSESSKLLRDRLYRSRDSGYCLAALGSPPEFPFLMMNINRAPADFNPANPARSVQPQHPQQQAAATNSYTAMAQHPIAHQAPVADQLAAGWIVLQDPSSGRTYYANQTTGQTSWEMPIAAPAPAPAPAPVPQQPVAHSQPQFQQTQPAAIVPQQPVAYSQPQFQQTQPVPVQPQQAATNGATTSTPSKLASKYGDGFVTSASHPALAQQYGNVGTSNPYTGAERPGTAAAVLAQSGSARAPVSGTFDPSKLTDLSPELQPIKDGLLELVSLLNTYPLGPADKKQMAEGEKGIAILLKRLALGDIDPEVASKMAAIVAALRSGDFASAAAIQTGLVSTDWRDNKDWLKGIKNVIQLTTKKIR
jgi:protein transport protein SEC31